MFDIESEFFLKDSESGFVSLPEGLEGMEPGAELAGILAGIEVSELSGYDRIVVLGAFSRLVAHFQAKVFEAMAAVSEYMDEIDDDPGTAWLSAEAEVRAALRLTRRAAEGELAFAVELKERLPRVWEALAAGEVDLRRARTIACGVGHLPVERAREVADRVIGDAPRLTTGQLAARIRRLCVEIDPGEAEERYRSAVEGRRVVAEATVEGAGNLLGLDLPAQRVALASKRINYLARSLKTSGESRTMDQLRADIFLDLLAGRAHGGSGSRGGVDIEVDLETLAGLVDRPGELAGFGPVIADIARQVVEEQARSEWRWAVTDPKSGQPLANGTTRRRPSAAQKRAVVARDRTCVFPGCRNPAGECDLDHTVPWAESGQTRVEDLAPGCRHDHVIRHRCRWTYQRLENGDYLWTSRLGHQYTTSGLPP